MLDLATADEWNKININRDSSLINKKQNISYYNQIFSMHNISKDDFYNSIKYYQNNPNELKPLLDSLNNFANKKRDSILNYTN